MKRFVSLFICFIFALSNLAVHGEENKKSELLYSKNYLPPASLGEPFLEFQPRHGIVAQYEGHDILCATGNGAVAVFNVFDLDANKLIFSSKLMYKSAWGHAEDSKGNVYVTTGPHLYQYNIPNNVFTYCGMYEKNASSQALCVDEYDNVYIGSYPNGNIVKYDPVEKKFIDFGQIAPNQQYVRALGYLNGYLYAGTISAPALVVKVNAKNPNDKVILEYPKEMGFNIESFKFVGGVTTINERYIFPYISSTDGNPFLLYDTKENKFVVHDFKGTVKGAYVLPENDGKMYFLEAASRNFIEVDLKTFEFTDTGVNYPYYDINGCGWATLDDPELPGKTFVTVTPNTYKPILINFNSKKVKLYDSEAFVGGANYIQNIARGPGNDLYMGGYMGEKASIYNVQTQEHTFFPCRQTEGIYSHNGIAYFGTYSGAIVYEYDTNQPFDVTSNPKILHTIQTRQDRPYAITGAKNMVIFGTTPTYAEFGGVLAIYHQDTGEWEEYRDVVTDQSINGVAYKDGFIYGGTHIWGGLGLPPKAKKAHMFIWDVAKKEKVAEFYPDIPGIDYDMLSIGDIAFGPDGLLWCASHNLLFAVNPKTLKVVKHFSFGPDDFNVDEPDFRPTFLEFDKDGLLYYCYGTLKVIDVKTMECRDLFDEGIFDYTKARIFDIGPDGNLYYAWDKNVLKVIPIVDKNTNFDKSMITETVSATKDSIALFIGRSNALSNGKITAIDENDKTVKPVVYNDHTLVPARFIAENVGAEVGWDDATQKVTIKKQDKVVEAILGENAIYINGEKKAIDTPAMEISGRTMLPLRAFAEAIGQNVFWDDRGLIVISDKPYSGDKKTTENLVLSFKYYISEIAENLKAAKEFKLMRDREVKDYGESLAVNNGGFESLSQGDTSSSIPGWEVLYKPSTEGSQLELSSVCYCEGSSSLKILDNSSENSVGVISDYISIDPSKDSMVSYALKVDGGRAFVGVKFYDSDKNEIGSVDNGYALIAGSWYSNKEIFETPENAKYARITLYSSRAYLADIYFDDVKFYQVGKK